MDKQQLTLGSDRPQNYLEHDSSDGTSEWRQAQSPVFLPAISIFSGAGGLDLGCEAAGFQTVAAVELDDTARATLLANSGRYFPLLDERSVFKDIVETPPGLLLERAGVRAGEPVLLHGGPPCVAFSKTGYWLDYKREGRDPKATLLDWFVGMAQHTKPKAVLMENVYGLAYKRSRHFLTRFLEGMSEAGYEMRWNILLAADHGVPQIRQRLFCVGLRRDLIPADPALWEFEWPAQTHAGPHETRRSWRDDLPPHVTAGEALADLSTDANPHEPEEVVAGTFEEELHAVPPGDNYLWWTSKRGHPSPRFEWRSRYWSFLLKLSPDAPSPTIQGQPGPWVGPFHWDSRRLRTLEVKRLMTFPDTFEVLGTRRQRQLQLGNAVPPELAERVANRLRAALVDIGALATQPSLALAA